MEQTFQNPFAWVSQTFQNLFTWVENLFTWVSPNYKIVLVGPKASGKTTILNNLMNGEVLPTTPTMGFNVETFEYNNISFTAWDFGGGEMTRPLVRRYFQNTQGLIFVVDSYDRDRVLEAKNELHRMLEEDELRDAVLLVCANKQDLPNAMTDAEIIETFDLHSLGQRHWYVQNTSAISGRGLHQGFGWLSEAIAN